VLCDLARDERIALCAIEDTARSSLRLLGASAFINPAVLPTILEHPTESAVATALRLQVRDGNAFLNRRQVAESNRRCDLVLLNFFGALHELEDAGLELHQAAMQASTTWTFFHSGFGFREIYTESADPRVARLLMGTGMRNLRQRPAQTGEPTWLFRVTRADALKEPALWPFWAMIPAAPKFGFTRQQQEVLERALLDCSDREIVQELGLTEDAVKKRWRSIYKTAARVEPALGTHQSGADLRRELLSRLRHNPAELRPYPRGGRAGQMRQASQRQATTIVESAPCTPERPRE
jgi:hypothetical protein